jgi:hypothetical protein
MKARNFSQKLVLNKNTIADLNSDAMKKVQGGLTEYPCVTDRLATRCETLECCGTYKRTCDC